MSEPTKEKLHALLVKAIGEAVGELSDDEDVHLDFYWPENPEYPMARAALAIAEAFSQEGVFLAENGYMKEECIP